MKSECDTSVVWFPKKEDTHGPARALPCSGQMQKIAVFLRLQPDKLYLPLDDDENAPTVQEQLEVEDSILNTVKNLIRLRKQNPALQAGGDFIPIYAEEKKYPFVYFRSAAKNKVLIAVNPSKKAATASFKLPTAETFVELKMVKGIRLRENKGVFTIKMDGLAYGVFSC